MTKLPYCLLLLSLIAAGTNGCLGRASQSQIKLTSQPETAEDLKARRVAQSWLRRGVSLQNPTPTQVIFSPDGQLLIGAARQRSFAENGSGDMQLQFSVWNARTGLLQATPLVSPSPPNEDIDTEYFVNFLDHNDILYVTGHNVFRLSAQGLIKRRYFGKGTYRGMACLGFSPDHKQLVLVMDDPFRPYSNPEPKRPVMRRLDLASGHLSLWKGDFGNAMLIDKMEMQGSRIALVFRYQSIRLLDAGARQIWKSNLPRPISDYVPIPFQDIAFSSAGRYLWTLEGTKDVMRLDTQTMQEKRFCSAADFSSLQINPDGRFLLLTNSNGRLAIYNTRTQRQVRQALFSFSTEHLTFSPDGKRLALGGQAVVPWDIK